MTLVNTKPLIYVIDDEPEICSLVCQELERYNFKTQAFCTGKEALLAIRKQLPSLCIIDLGLPDMDGLSLVKELFDDKKIGVIILSGRNSLPDKVLGLELGADDYIGKPFDPRELVARVNSIIRRLVVSELPETTLQTASFGDWTFEQSTLTLENNKGDSFMLSAAEAEILMILLKAPRQILSRERLLSLDATSFDRSIDVRMSRLRKKIEQDHKHPKIIKTVYGAGYIFTLEVTWQ
ncbi:MULTISPECIES: response regulator transcription factor [unclassified Colwellia]|jgi:DNA-binding response OmpR family regulator|uniref:response regulator transcription factor n=1 Tax=unclassified Colwellia TaxID=196834 RepID=UPI00209071F4|nr:MULTISPECIES: response regulator transcription factor [unclassified Colwellia]MDO6652115.1 response regulator transcription factor [Colwellia sp. 3_MG-2023]MDO6664891.1 response regulator transcription factor [Colwellia sp. 2_MG-2023]